MHELGPLPRRSQRSAPSCAPDLDPLGIESAVPSGPPAGSNLRLGGREAGKARRLEQRRPGVPPRNATAPTCRSSNAHPSRTWRTLGPNCASGLFSRHCPRIPGIVDRADSTKERIGGDTGHVMDASPVRLIQRIGGRLPEPDPLAGIPFGPDADGVDADVVVVRVAFGLRGAAERTGEPVHRARRLGAGGGAESALYPPRKRDSRSAPIPAGHGLPGALLQPRFLPKYEAGHRTKEMSRCADGRRVGHEGARVSR